MQNSSRFCGTVCTVWDDTKRICCKVNRLSCEHHMLHNSASLIVIINILLIANLGQILGVHVCCTDITTIVIQVLNECKFLKCSSDHMFPCYLWLTPSAFIPLIQQVTLYRVIPWRFTSRLWGQVNDKNLPERLRQPLLGLYVWLFGCDVTEALVEDLTYYKNLQEFFKRQLKPEVRPIDQQHALVRY